MATNTYKQHPPVYYSIRTFVRFVFWGSIATLLFVGMMVGLDALHYRNAKPACDVTVNRDFTWDWKGTPVALTDCSSPTDIVLNDDRTWDWYDPYIHG